VNRRRFIGRCATAGLSAALGDWCIGGEQGKSAAAATATSVNLLIADPHAHPEWLHGGRSFDRSTPTLDVMKQLNMALCACSAVGDMTYMRGRSGMPFADTKNQLEKVRRWEEQGHIRLLERAADLPALIAARKIPAGLMAIEGGDALEGQLQNLDTFHAYGVRLMTLMHERDNEIGFNQRSGADGPLTPFGVRVVERMNAIGMIVDVSHAKAGTLKSIIEVSARPLLDSHTSPFLPGEENSGSRLFGKELAKNHAQTLGRGNHPDEGAPRHRALRPRHGWRRRAAAFRRRLGIDRFASGSDRRNAGSRLDAGRHRRLCRRKFPAAAWQVTGVRASQGHANHRTQAPARPHRERIARRDPQASGYCGG
jgi:hypothetical protein